MSANAVKDKLARGELVLGTFVMEFASPGLARIVAAAGCELIVLDMEHSGWSFETAKRQIAHARDAGLVPIVDRRTAATAAPNSSCRSTSARSA